MYAALLQGDDSAIGISRPLLVGAVLQDNAGRGESLLSSYRRALEQL